MKKEQNIKLNFLRAGENTYKYVLVRGPPSLSVPR
jgi:hypothetical protein